MVWTSRFHCQSLDSIPGQGTEIMANCTEWPKQNSQTSRKKKIPGSVGSVREGPQGQQDTPVLTCRGSHGRAVLGPAPGLVHMGASRAENSAHRACRGGVTPWASPSLLSQAPRAPKHKPQGLLKHLSHQNLLTSILPFRKRKPVIKPPKCRKETFPRENESF